MTDTPRDNAFLIEIDGMIESTEEFIADDGLRADDSRIHDLSALIRVRELYTNVFSDKASSDPDNTFGLHANE